MKRFIKRSGFTMAETIIALAVTGIMVMANLMIIAMMKNQNQIKEKRFFDTVSVIVENIQASAELNNRTNKITFHENGCVTFTLIRNNRYLIKKIQIPTSLKLKQNHSVNVTKNGFISPQTIRWYGTDARLKYKQKFQLGWSGFNLEKNY